jgi:HD-GYP domain-containing protein (c-di-GMP phosphodiesterase class II)
VTDTRPLAPEPPAWAERIVGLFPEATVSSPYPSLFTVERGGCALLLGPAALFLDEPWMLRRQLDLLPTEPRRFVLVGSLTVEQARTAQTAGMSLLLDESVGDAALLVGLERAFDDIEDEVTKAGQKQKLIRTEYELREIIEISRALITERETETLLALILEKSRFITGADAGSLYVVEGDGPELADRLLQFRLSQNDSVTFDWQKFTMPISRSSMAGWAALERQTIRIPDAYQLGEDSPVRFDRSFDERTGYRTRSILCTPLVSSRGDVLGVIQLINKKRNPRRRLTCSRDFEHEVVPFDDRSQELLLTLAAQAGVALETALLYEEIRGLFDGFVRASVDAIEARDPTTSGHSRRVAEYTVRLAQAVERTDQGPYAGAHFTRQQLRELEYAALLHDFGKIGVRENVLVKAKKLYPHQLDQVRARLEFAMQSLRTELAERRMELIQRSATEAEFWELDRESSQRQLELEGALATVLSANEPTVLRSEQSELITQMSRLHYRQLDGTSAPLLSSEEVESLMVSRGSLTHAEMEEIRSHVTHTYRFLSRIPWGRTFAGVPTIAGAHHERLNGTGYPGKLTANAIPLQAKMMSVADIFDALTASDRPYKRAVPIDKAIDILGYEVKDGHLDPDLVALFAAARVWE